MADGLQEGFMIFGLSLLGLFAFAAAGIAWMRLRQGREIRYHAALRRTVILRSDAFAHGETIPETFTCRGEALSPPLAWSNLPPGTKSLALVVTDEDLPVPVFPFFHIVHWGLYNIPGSVANFAEGLTDADLETAKIRAVRNWSGGTRYYPPCPLYGDHRYAFRMYALDAQRFDDGIRSRSGLLKAMKPHILAYGELIGRCQRRPKPQFG
jgi:Raf kinase inhibitor-like YbhB/YbcL family protein